MIRLGRAALSLRGFVALVFAGVAFGHAAGAGAAEEPGEIAALAFDGTATVAAANGVWRRGNGEDWQRVGGAAPVAALAVHPDLPGVVYAGGPFGIRRSDDGGRSWIETGLTDVPVTAVTVAAGAPETVYAAVEGDGLWVSRDGGASWEFAMDRPYLGGAEHDILTLASVDAATGMGGIWLYAGTAAGLTRVPDCFCRWQDVQPGDAMDALVAGEAPAPVRPLPAGEPLVAIGVVPDDPEVLYAAAGPAIWKSSDMGVNWDRMHGVEAHALAIDPADADHVLAATSDGLIETQDGGQTWSATANS